MRFLILSAFVTCAAAAPSGFLTPVVTPLVAPVVAPVATVYAAAPTISPGDIQAAAIDAQVKYQDAVIANVDKARELSELANENLNEKAFASNDQVKEKVEEQFWSVEDQKWQALDALKTAEAQIDGSVANNAEVLAKSVVGGPYAITYSHPANIVGSVVPQVVSPSVVYTPLAGAAVKAADVKVEEKSELVKSAEVKEEKKDDSVAVEAAPEKTEKVEASVKSVEPVVGQVIAPFQYTVGAPIGAPVASPLFGAPVLGYSAVQTFGLNPVYRAW